MKLIYATALIDFQIDHCLKTPIAIKKDLYITNNPAHTAGFINSSHLITIGTLEARPLTGGSVVLYKIDELKEPSDAETEVVNFLRETQAFLTATWLKEDNSANCELAFAFAFAQDPLFVHSNALSLHYTSHEGVRKLLTVNSATLAEICELHAKSFQGARDQDKPNHTVFRRAIGRVDRSMLFLQQARSSSDLGQKIANYCSFFEAVLSTSSVELSHQLAERAAFFLSDIPEKRLQLFREVKKAYGVRSKIVHGDVLSPSMITSLIDIAQVCDGVARSVLLKILNDPNLDALFEEGTNDSLDAYMFNLIFGLKTADNQTGTEP